MRPCFDSRVDVADRDRLVIGVFVHCFGEFVQHDQHHSNVAKSEHSMSCAVLACENLVKITISDSLLFILIRYVTHCMSLCTQSLLAAISLPHLHYPVCSPSLRCKYFQW